MRALVRVAAAAIVFTTAVYVMQEKLPSLELTGQTLLERAKETYRRERERRRFESSVLFDLYQLDEAET